MKRIVALLTGAAMAVAFVACSSDAADTPGDAPAAAVATAASTSAAASLNAGTPITTTAGGSSAAAAATASSTGTAASSNAGTPITITAGGRTITATLNDSAVARDFAAMLPVTLPWFRNAGIEYISELRAPLTETGPFYTAVRAGDIVYYNPRDSITIIYAPTSSVPTLTKMGEVTSDLSVFRDLPDTVEMRIERR